MEAYIRADTIRDTHFGNVRDDSRESEASAEETTTHEFPHACEDADLPIRKTQQKEVHHAAKKKESIEHTQLLFFRQRKIATSRYHD